MMLVMPVTLLHASALCLLERLDAGQPAKRASAQCASSCLQTYSVVGSNILQRHWAALRAEATAGTVNIVVHAE